MSYWDHKPSGDYRNEGWTVNGTGITHLWEAWSSTDDTKYCYNPSYKGRACVSFPIDITQVPDGAVVTSITIYLRCKKTDSGRRSITVNLIPSDDTSKFTTRTIYPDGTIRDYEVGTYRVDPTGEAWTRHRINKILCQVFSYSGVGGVLRCYRLYCRINYRVRPTVSVDAPTGTVNTPSPTISWTYSQDDGDPQKMADYRIWTAAQQEAVDFNPDAEGKAVFAGKVEGDLTSVILPTALPPNDYYTYVRVQSSFGAKSVWTSRAFTVAAAAPGVPGGGNPGGGSIGTGAGAGFVSVVADNTQGSAFMNMRDGSNLLSVQAANFENDTDYIGYGTSNCSVARDTTTFFNIGGGCMKMTASTAATMQATSEFVEIAPSTPITARAQIKANTTGRTVNLRTLFFDVNFASIAGTISGNVIDSNSTWNEVSCTGTTPSGAAYAKVQVEVVSPGSSESHFVDAVGLMYGSNSVWSHGGHASRNLLTAVASTADNPLVGSEPWTPVSTATAYVRTTTTGTGSHGSNAFRLTYNGLVPTLSFVAAGAVYSDTSTSTGYTLNKPAGVVDGDLLIAYVLVDGTSAGFTTPSTDWKVVNTSTATVGSNTTTMFVLKKDGLTADPTSWVGNFGATSSRRRAIVMAYRGAAPAASQFGADKVASSTSGSTAITTATVNNTTANGWRLAAFGVRDDVTGSMIANILPPSIPPAIQFVARGSVWKSTSASATFTINKPAGIQSGDLMIATVNCVASFSGGAGLADLTTPTGWTLVNNAQQSDSQSYVTTAVFRRVATGSEPNSWTTTLGSGSTAVPTITQCVAYRNVDTSTGPFIATGIGTSGSGSTISTPSVTNTNSGAWRVESYIFSGTSAGGTTTSTETSERADDSVATADESGIIACYDSNGSVSTGSQSRSGTFSASGGYRAAAAWIGLLKPLSSSPAPGANETERTDGTTGVASTNLTLAVYDSAAAIGTGNTSVTGVYTPASGTTIDQALSWIGILKPATPVVSGEASATLSDYVRISSVDSTVLDLADNKVTFQASFLGSVAGTPYLTVYFYNGNELISSQTGTGTSFGTTTWVKSAVTFDLPDGTTRLKCGVAVRDRVISDIVYFDRASLAFGDSTVWRAGTGGDAHPIWSIPIIEYADDDGTGYGDWSVLPGTVTNPPIYDPLTGLTSFHDHTLVPLSYRKYRAKTVSYGLAGDVFESDYGQVSPEVTVTPGRDEGNTWWLKDIKDPSNNMQLKVKADPLSVATSSTAAVFQPLGADLPNVLTEGFKGDRLDITVIATRTEFQQLRDLLKTGRTLYLQSNMDNAWWVRPVSDIGAETQLTGQRGTNPLRFVKLSFVQVAAEL